MQCGYRPALPQAGLDSNDKIIDIAIFEGNSTI